jgi:hypothetical protein
MPTRRKAVPDLNILCGEQQGENHGNCDEGIKSDKRYTKLIESNPL